MAPALEYDQEPIKLIGTRSPLNIREEPGNAYDIVRTVDDKTILLNYGEAKKRSGWGQQSPYMVLRKYRGNRFVGIRH